MANPNDVQIPQPVTSGATDVPDAPQSGAVRPPLPAGFSDTPPAPVAVPRPPLPQGFSDTPEQALAAQQDQQQKDSPANHGILERAWDWINKPIADRLLLPKDIKTVDLVKAAAFQKMYGESYIPGVNDFDTKSELHMSDTPTKAYIKTFLNGAAKDASGVVAGMTSPLQAGLMLTGAGEAGLLGKTAATVAKPIAAAAGVGFGAYGGSQAVQAALDATKNGVSPENIQKMLMGLGMSLAGATGIMKSVENLMPTKASIGYPRASHVYDPVNQEVRPVADITAERQPSSAGVGSEIQGSAKSVKGTLGARVGAATDAARQLPIAETPSADFAPTLQDISNQVSDKIIKGVPSELDNVKNIVDEIASKDKLTHEDFRRYDEQLSNRIESTPKTEPNAKRLYTQTKNALRNEYYNQLTDADPAVSAKLQDMNADYAELMGRLNRGPAKTLFKTNAPEQVISAIVDGKRVSAGEGILQTIRDYDTQNPPDVYIDPTTGKPQIDAETGEPKTKPSVEQDVRDAAFHEFLRKYSARTDKGLLSRIDADGAIQGLEKSPTLRDLLGKDSSEALKDSLKAEATKQKNFNRAKWGTVFGGSGLGVGGTIWELYQLQKAIREQKRWH